MSKIDDIVNKLNKEVNESFFDYEDDSDDSYEGSDFGDYDDSDYDDSDYSLDDYSLDTEDEDDSDEYDDSSDTYLDQNDYEDEDEDYECDPIDAVYYSDIAEQPFDRVGNDIATLFVYPFTNGDVSSRYDLACSIRDAFSKLVTDCNLDYNAIDDLKSTLSVILDFNNERDVDIY